MTTKQLTRKVLNRTNRFIIGDLNGQKWYCPDGYFATDKNIYADYKPLKSNQDRINNFRDVNTQPKMQAIFDKVNEGNYVQVEQLNKHDCESFIYLQAGNHKVTIQKDYYLLLEALYPEAHFEINTSYKYMPVKVVEKNKTVGLIMPLKD